MDSGDTLTESFFILNGRLLQWEAHYFQLMASMRMLRMRIPAFFSPEQLEEEVMEKARDFSGTNAPTGLRAEFRVVRQPKGENGLTGREDIAYSLNFKRMDRMAFLELDQEETHIYLEQRLPANLISGLSTPPNPVLSIAEIFTRENGWADSVIINEHKRVQRTVRGILWVFTEEGTWKTPSYEEGAPRSVYREQFRDYLRKDQNMNVLEAEISPFELSESSALTVQTDPYGFHLIQRYKRKEFKHDRCLTILQAFQQWAIHSSHAKAAD